MASALRDVGSYNPNLGRTYRWKFSITEFPGTILGRLAQDYPLLYARIGGSVIPTPGTPADVSSTRIIPFNSYCTEVNLPPEESDAIQINIGGDGLELPGFKNQKNFTAVFLVDANWDFYKVCRLWAEVSILGGAFAHYLGTFRISHLSGDQREVGAYEARYAWLRGLEETPLNSESDVGKFTITISTFAFKILDINPNQ